MTLTEAIRAVALQPASVHARAQLALVLDQMGTLEASRVWAAAVRLAAGRGQFFPALYILRLHVRNKPLQTQLFVELANRFGAERPHRDGPSVPPPIVSSQSVSIPESLDRQIFTAVEWGCRLDGLVLPEGAAVPEVPLFGALPTTEFIAFALLLEEMMLPGGSTFIQQDDTEQSIYLLANGRVRIHKHLSDGTAVELATVSSPAVIGEMSLLTAVPRRASVTAQGRSLAWKISAKALGHLARAHPILLEQLNLVVKRRLLSNLIQNSQLFRAEQTHIDALLRALEVVHIKPQQHVFGQGEEPPGLFIVLHGEAEVWTQKAPEQERTRIATLNEGDVFGEMSLLSGKHTTAAVWMPDGGVVLHLPRPSFEYIRRTMPSFEGQLNTLMLVRHNELQSIVAPWQHFEPIEPEEADWMTGDFERFVG